MLAMKIKLAAAGVLVAALVASHWYAYASGRTAILARLASDRITILQDGKEIDNAVLEADNDGLCLLLGGCVQSESE